MVEVPGIGLYSNNNNLVSVTGQSSLHSLAHCINSNKILQLEKNYGSSVWIWNYDHNFDMLVSIIKDTILICVL